MDMEYIPLEELSNVMMLACELNVLYCICIHSTTIFSNSTDPDRLV